MYCGQCGKKVMENMLFCPFCGSPIVIPDQDDVQAEAPRPETVKPAAAPSKPVKQEAPEKNDRPVSLFDFMEPEEEPIPQESFVPLSFNFETQLKETDAAAAMQAEESLPGGMASEAETALPDAGGAEAAGDIVVEVPEDMFQEMQPDPEERPRSRERRAEQAPRRTGGASKRSASTYVPVRDLNPDNMFMDELDGDDHYDAEEEDEPVRRGRYRDEFEYEEPEDGTFFQRHIRGIVGLILMLILLIVCAVWAFSPKGQLALARINLAWTAQPYADLGYDAYQMDSDLLAAKYYEKAFSRDTDNYEYAHSAMVAYYEAEKIESAAAMLKKCVEMAPDNPEPYQEMLILYPDAQSRPWEITELIRLGYQRTGHEALKLN